MAESKNFTLVGDVPSDIALCSHLKWALEQAGIKNPNVQYADTFKMGCRGKDLRNKILRALHFYPCDILFVHRDAEKEHSDRRREEILLPLAL